MEGFPLCRGRTEKSRAERTRGRPLATRAEQSGKVRPPLRRETPPRAGRAGTRDRRRLSPGQHLATRIRRLLPLRRNPRPTPRHYRRQKGHGIDQADGPPHLRRCRLRENRSRHPHRLQSRHGRPASRPARPHHRARPTTLADPARTDVRLPHHGRIAQPLPHGQTAKTDPGRTARRQCRHRGRHPPPARQRCLFQKPRTRRGRRGTAVWRIAQRTAERKLPRRRRSHPLGHPHPAHPLSFAPRSARHEHDRDAAGQPHSDRDRHLRL